MDSSIILGVTLGVVIGGAYAAWQLAALRKNEQRQREAGAPSLAGMVPGSMLRVALLLIALVVVQIVVPAEYKTQNFYWSLTISLAVTYSIPFAWKLKDMMRK